ncbi:thioredoxin domain-containing protein [Myxococcota bacterium]|nr:thioredoxin domain-containing protein [Myxococcota bacterium]
MKFAMKALLVALVGFGLSACVSRGEIEEIKKNQKEMLSKLDQIAKRGPAAPSRGKKPAQRAGRPDPTATYAFPVGDSAVKGKADAWVTIIEVSEFQCPFCNRVNPTIKQVREKYGDDVRIVFKHNPLPFHKRARNAAMAAECGNEQGKFWPIHDSMFANNKALEDADLEKYAKDAGVAMPRWKKCYTANKYAAKIDADQKIATSLGARGTPAFFINGRFLSGAQPFANFEKLITEELKKAKASGMSKKDYYTKAVVAKGKKKL